MKRRDGWWLSAMLLACHSPPSTTASTDAADAADLNAPFADAAPTDATTVDSVAADAPSADAPGPDAPLGPTRTLTVSTAAATGTVVSVPPGIDCGPGHGPCTAHFTEGQEVELVAQPGSAATFSHWAGACAGGTPTCTVTMTSDRAVEAVFQIGAPLTMQVTGDGDGIVRSSPSGLSCPPACVQAFQLGQTAVLTPMPSSTARFAGWDGACAGATWSCTLAMDVPRQATASFAPDGIVAWRHVLGGPGYEPAVQLAGGGGSVAVLVFTAGPVDFGNGPTSPPEPGQWLVMASYDPNGSVRWHRWVAPTGGWNIKDLEVSAAGDVVIAGVLNGVVDLGGGPLTSIGVDAFVAVYRGSDGGFAWARRLGGPQQDVATAVSVRGGTVAVLGDFRVSANFGGGLVVSAGGTDWFVARYEVDTGAYLSASAVGGVADDTSATLADLGGDVVVSGRCGVGSLGTQGGTCVTRLVPESGAALWTVAPLGYLTFVDAIATSDGDVVLATTYTGSIDLGTGTIVSEGTNPLLLRLHGGTGETSWARFVGAPGGATAKYLSGEGDTIALAAILPTNGSLSSPTGVHGSAGELDTAVVRVSAIDGATLGARFVGGALTDDVGGIALVDGVIIAAGSFAGPIDLGAGTIVPDGYSDGWLMAFPP